MQHMYELFPQTLHTVGPPLALGHHQVVVEHRVHQGVVECALLY